MQEVDAAKLAESGKLTEALEVLDAAIARAPTRASGYNNRAQVHQLMNNLDAAMADLNKAIQDCELYARVAKNAFAQRAILHRLKGNDQAALDDFTKAGRYGNEWARKMAVKLNPYSALCNDMLAKAMSQLKDGSQADN